MYNHKSTIHYYNMNSDTLLTRYDNADMKQLYSIIDEVIQQNSKVLDIGFGSGRDLAYLLSKGHDIWGIDASKYFVENAKKRFEQHAINFFKTQLPSLETPKHLNNSFDAILCIAVWMHLEYLDYNEAVENICKLCKPTATVLMSYSDGDRDEVDDRFFEHVDKELLISLFEKKGFYIIKEQSNDDSFQRQKLTWYTLVFKRD